MGNDVEKSSENEFTITGFRDKSPVATEWRPITTAKSKPLELGFDDVLEVKCSVTWKNQGYGNQKAMIKLALMSEGTEVANEILFPKRASNDGATQERTLK
jgi:hypothetical protein